MFSDDEYEKPSSLIRASIEIDCLKDNMLSIKNSIMDQACLLKVLDNRNESIKKLELENTKLKQEFLKLKQEKSELPQKFEELDEKLKRTQAELQSQQLLNEQVEFNNNSAADRLEWAMEKKKLLLSMGAKERQINTIKEMYDKNYLEVHLQKEYYERIIGNLQETQKKENEAYEKKSRKKKKKVRQLKKHLIKKHLECLEYRKLYKKFKSKRKL